MKTILTALGLVLFCASSTFAGSKDKRDCYCTDKTGARVELGQTICLNVDGRAFMARCEMSLNVPMWRETGRNCLSSRNDRLPQSHDPRRHPFPVNPKI